MPCCAAAALFACQGRTSCRGRVVILRSEKSRLGGIAVTRDVYACLHDGLYMACRVHSAWHRARACCSARVARSTGVRSLPRFPTVRYASPGLRHSYPCAFRRVKDHYHLLYYSPLLKNTCVGQVVLDK